MEPYADAFHRHLDNCQQCEQHPMELCPTGAELLRKAAEETCENIRGREKVKP